MKDPQGNEIPVITSNLATLKIGRYKLKNFPVQITTANKPLKDKNIHILGNEVLKKFNLFFDFQHNYVYLKPNKLFNAKYTDQKNGTYEDISIAGRKFLSSRFFLIVQFVIFKKTCYKKSSPTKTPKRYTTAHRKNA